MNSRPLEMTTIATCRVVCVVIREAFLTFYMGEKTFPHIIGNVSSGYYNL